MCMDGCVYTIRTSILLLGSVISSQWKNNYVHTTYFNATYFLRGMCRRVCNE